MGKTTFSGPIATQNGMLFVPRTTATLPAPASVEPGLVMLITDNGAGNNEWCLVINTGAAWVVCDGTALS